MRKLFGPSLRIGISPRSLTLLQVGSRWRRQPVTLVADHAMHHDGHASIESLALQLRTMLAEAQCTDLRTEVLLADELVRYFTVTPPKNAASLADCRAAALLRFQSLYGEPAADWHIEADWQAASPFVACAMPMALRTALLSILRERSLSLIRMTPQFIATWNQYATQLKDDAWFGLVHDHGITVGIIESGLLRAIRVLYAADGEPLAWLPSRLSREALTLGVAPPDRIQLAGMLPAHWAPGTLGTLACERVDAASRILPVHHRRACCSHTQDCSHEAPHD
jgi:hypothetical protein